MAILIADIITPLVLLVLICTLAMALCSVFHSLKVNKRKAIENGIKVGIIGWSTFILMLCITLPVLLIGSFTDMCIIATILMLLISGCCILYSLLHATRLRRK